MARGVSGPSLALSSTLRVVRMFDGTDVQFSLGPLRLVPGRRALLADGAPVAIHGRAFDLLAALVENRERVVGRDELLAQVWAGTTVSDSNIAVQVAALRRILSAHGVDARSIVNVPGRGYQFVGEVVPEPASPAIGAPVAATAGSGAAEQVGRTTKAGWQPWHLRAAGCVCLAVALAAGVARLSEPGAPRQDERLTVAMDPFSAHGPAPAADLAQAYRAALDNLPARYGDIRFFSIDDAGATRPAHFRLSGTVRVLGTEATLGWKLTRPDGELVDSGRATIPFTPGEHERAVTAAAIVTDIKPRIMAWENRARTGPPHDALDFYIRAQADYLENDTIEHCDRAIADLRAALARDPNLFAARLLLEADLNDRAILRPAQEGNEDGREALRISDTLLRDDNRNLLVIQARVETLVALARPEEAAEVARRGLAIDATDRLLRWTLLDADEESGHLADADAVVKDIGVSRGSMSLAQLAFAEGHDAEVLDQLDAYLPNEGNDLQRELMSLLKAASLVRLDRVADARALISDMLAQLPPGFRNANALRRTYYELSPAAWASFRSALGAGGMPA